MGNNLWGHIDLEHLVALSLDEAIGEYVFRLYDEAGPDVCLPTAVSFAEYEPMEISRHRLNPLERLLEDLDEEYAVVDGIDSTVPNEAMKIAEEAFLAVILAEYRVQAYEAIPGTETVVNVREWQQIRAAATAQTATT